MGSTARGRLWSSERYAWCNEEVKKLSKPMLLGQREPEGGHLPYIKLLIVVALSVQHDLRQQGQP